LALAIIGLLPSLNGDLHAFNIIFSLAAIPGILAALSIVLLVKERPHPTLKGTTFAGSLRLLPNSYRRYLVGVFVYGCGDFSNTLLIMYAVQSLTPHFGHSAGAIAIQLYALHNFLYAVGAYPAGALADRFGKRGFLIAAYVLGTAMNLLLAAAAPSLVTLALVFIIAGVVYALQQSLERAIAADIVPVEVRTSGFGVLASANGIGDLISSAIVGILWTAFSPTVAFSYAFVVTCAGTIVTMVALRSSKDVTSP
jgi:MFS family permease